MRMEDGIVLLGCIALRFDIYMNIQIEEIFFSIAKSVPTHAHFQFHFFLPFK